MKFLAGILCVSLALVAVVAQDETGVRPLRFMPKDPTFAFNVGGMSKATTLASAAAAEKFVGKESAKTLLSLVDLDKEMIVFVSWTTSGPPDGTLQHEVVGKGEKRRVNFYVQAPPGAKIRGERARLGADFFAVPKNVAVFFEAKERP